MPALGENSAKGIIMMILSMGAFAVADTLVKVTSSSISPAQVLFFLNAGGLIVFATIAVWQGERLVDANAFKPILLLRYISEVFGMAGMVLALSYVPLSTVGAITQATPLLVAVGAVIFLKEKVSWRRWSSIVVGFIGVLLIVQPGGTEFDYAVLWAVLAMFALSVRDLTTRLTPIDMASSSLATYTMLAAVPFAMAWVFYNGETLLPANVNWVIVITMIGLGSAGYLLLIASLRMAQASAVTPFRYARIIFLLILGTIVFDERPGLLVLLGATLIIASGIYIMWREQKVKNQAN